jgi:hypothetical protein
LFVGATYQMIYVDEPYYSIPQDIYKSNVGLDYAGASVADNANIPIVDKYRGVDNMHQSGHFLSFLGGYDLSTDIQVGVSISRVVFDRDGNFGSTNLWDYPYTSNYTSSWYNMESRNQIYRHWDFSAGANFKVEKEGKLGLMGGYLAGKANQGLFHQDTSFYSSNPIGTTNYSAGYRNASTDQQWNDDGKTYYAGLNMRLPVGQARFFNIYYRYSRQDIDLVSASSILDTSKSSYRYQWDTTTSTGNSHYYLSDVRTGKGTKTGTLHRFVVSYQWNPERNMNFDIGISFESQSKETWTNELITSTRNSSNMWTNNATTTNSTYATAESKNLVWSFNTKLTTIQIPIFLNWKTSEKTSVILGLNRKISDWEISDVTLALFNYRDQINDGVATHKENFGERYTMPTEKTSDIQTTFVLGLVVAPADYFSVRVLATPTVTDDRYIITSTVFQWWIGVQVHP